MELGSSLEVLRNSWVRVSASGVDPYGSGGHVPPIFTLGGTSISMPPPQCLRTSILKQHALAST